MAGLKDWSTTAASNNSASPNGFPENMAPSGVNDAAREVMAQVRGFYENAQWQNLGDVPTRTGAGTFTVPSSGTHTAVYHINRRLKLLDGSNTFYGSIKDQTFAGGVVTATVTLDSGALTTSLSQVYVSCLTFSNPGAPPHPDSFPVVAGDSTDVAKAKQLRFDVETSVTSSTTRVLTIPAADGTIAITADITAAVVASAGASLVFIKSQTVAASGTPVDFINGTSSVVFDSTYDAYVLKFTGVYPATNGSTIGIRVTEDGATFKSGASDYVMMASGIDSAGSTASVTGSKTNMQLTSASSNSATHGHQGEVWFHTPSAAVGDKSIYGHISYHNGSNYVGLGLRGGYVGTGNAITGFRILASSGNMTGTFYLYGLKKS